MVSTGGDDKPKVFVVTSEVSKSPPVQYLLRNYHAPTMYDANVTLGNFCIPTRRDEPELLGIPLWSAARATSAAPTYFVPYEYNQYKFVDGGLLANCPVEVAIQEAFAMFPNASIDYILSIGTGIYEKPVTSGASVLKFGSMMVDIVTDTERIIQNTQRWLGSACKGVRTDPIESRSRFIRWNPTIPPFPLDVSEKASIVQMQACAKEYINTQVHLGEVQWIVDKVEQRLH